MSYTKQTWVSGDIITADKMNYIESGIKAIDDETQRIADKIYPVGSIYMSINDTSPTLLFGGTWVQIKDTFLLSAGDTYEAGSSGGEATHILTEAEMPSHAGHLDRNEGVSYGVGNSNRYLNASAMTEYTTQRGWNDNGSEFYPAGVSRGLGQAHNNMPPYLTVYMWQRTA